MTQWNTNQNPMRELPDEVKIVRVKGDGTGHVLDVDFDNGERLRVESDMLYQFARGHLANFLADDVDNGRWVIRAIWRKEREK